MTWQDMKIGNYIIGIDKPCFIIAEVGMNHNGSFELAEQMIKSAADAGADAVKFQNFKTEDFLSDKKLPITYKYHGKEITEPLWDACKRSEFKREWIPDLKKMCDELGVVFFSTPTSEEGIDDLINSGVEALKNGSDYLTQLPLLRYMGTTGVPVIVSTGMANQQDVDDAVEAVKSGGKSRVVLMHCVSTYPTAIEDLNLNKMVTLMERYNLPVGFSDHTGDFKAAVQAVTLKACMVEKHFTVDKNLPGADQNISCNPEEFNILVREIRDAEKRMGAKNISPAKGEMCHKDQSRIGLVAARDIQAGSVLVTEDVAYRKPALGLLPKQLNDVLGRVASVSISSGEPLRSEQLS
ncbi:MAG: N-acetylneuraminate synthase [Planctomycetes bacterium]|nr:N-acetylneuraminate synthase [Planctomycetota bacterium]